MTNWIEPSDSPIWRSLGMTHPNLEMTVKQKVFVLLQDTDIPPTNKIFPWVVETMINRVAMDGLGEKLTTVERNLSGLPEQIVQVVNQSVSTPVKAIESNQSTLEKLTVELRRNSVIESSLTQSGWRGVLCSLEAIAQNKILGLTVFGVSLLSALMGGGFVWSLGEGDRTFLKFNRQSIENCYDKFATDQDGNGWFSCSGIQLPMR